MYFQYCWGMGGYLVELESSAEEHDIRQYLPSGNHYWIGTILYSTVQYSTVQYHYWIGLNDQAQELQWVWSNSHQVAGYTNWQVSCDWLTRTVLTSDWSAG